MRAYLTVLDGDAELVPYFVRHYSRLGATRFPVLIYSDDPTDMARVCGQVEEAGGLPERLGMFRSDYFSAKRRDAFIRDHHPRGQWAFFADLDEFAELTREQVERFVRSGCRFVAGRWLDRVAEGGKLANLVPGVPLETTFPLGTYTRRQLKAGDWVYVLSPRGPDLHHPNVCSYGKKHFQEVPRVPVHHFKWQLNVLTRLRRRIERIDALPATAVRKNWRARIVKTLGYLEQHGGGVDAAKLDQIGNRLGV